MDIEFLAQEDQSPDIGLNEGIKMKPVINKRKCPAQEAICKAILSCPNEALTYMADENEPLGGRIVVNEDLCSECGICVEECCGHAIAMA